MLPALDLGSVEAVKTEVVATTRSPGSLSARAGQVWARPDVGSGVWGIWDGGGMGRRAPYLAEPDARQQAADLNVTFTNTGNATKPIAEKSAR